MAGDLAERAPAFLAVVCGRVAARRQWMAAGFIHGVLNTDNINITGESFDYGPWRWLPSYDPAFTAAYFDESGSTPMAASRKRCCGTSPGWRSACRSPDKDALIAALEGFGPAFRREYDCATVRRLGLAPTGAEADGALAQAWWAGLAESQMPFEQAFFAAFGGELGPNSARPFAPARALLAERSRPATEHRYFAQPAACTLLIEEVEAIWAAIAERDDWSVFTAKLEAIREMGQALGLA